MKNGVVHEKMAILNVMSEMKHRKLRKGRERDALQALQRT